MKHQELSGHERFMELGALANTGILSCAEWRDLIDHLQSCSVCKEVYDHYFILSSRAIPLLGEASGVRDLNEWDETGAWERLSASVQVQNKRLTFAERLQQHLHIKIQLLRLTQRFAVAAVLPCLMIIVGLFAYRMGRHAQQPSREAAFHRPMSDDQGLNEILDRKERTLATLQATITQKTREASQLRAYADAAEVSVKELEQKDGANELQLQEVSRERDVLNARLQEATQAYQDAAAELANLRSDRDKLLIRISAAETALRDLTAIDQDKESKLKQTEQYLAYDGDIRELMGARKLYIADVFDVDSNSRQQKPFGRIFYTQGRSLVFYAFDLDKKPALKNAATFQAWGRNETDRGKPVNLGILYLDSVANRRWVLRTDDARQLEDIDAVFVTAEPEGGSRRPTSKPFLYALLRKEANHP